jgi:hypothetical protein
MLDPPALFALSTGHLLTAERLIAEQRALIHRFATSGRDVRDAWQLLTLLEDVQSQMVRHHASIVRDMEAGKRGKRAALM